LTTQQRRKKVTQISRNKKEQCPVPIDLFEAYRSPGFLAKVLRQEGGKDEYRSNTITVHYKFKAIHRKDSEKSKKDEMSLIER
jgi:hypothetical protein